MLWKKFNLWVAICRKKKVSNLFFLQLFFLEFSKSLIRHRRWQKNGLESPLGWFWWGSCPRYSARLLKIRFCQILKLRNLKKNKLASQNMALKRAIFAQKPFWGIEKCRTVKPLDQIFPELSRTVYRSEIGQRLLGFCQILGLKKKSCKKK